MTSPNSSEPGTAQRRIQGALALCAVAALLVYAAWPWLPRRGSRPPRSIVVYGFSILGEAMTEGIFPSFQTQWRRQTGETVEFASSFAGSGTVTNQILLGVPADVAILALEPDAERLATGGATSPGSWRKLPFSGVVNRTPFVILVRPGNPKKIRRFADLARPGVAVVHPDPLTSGGANWAILAEYGAGLRAPGGSPESARRLLSGIWRNVVAQAASARAARTQFENGFGDALITYEQEAAWDRSLGKLPFDVVYPESTILSEHVAVLIERNVSPKRRRLIEEFLRFLWSETAQRTFVRYGFRSVESRYESTGTASAAIPDAFTVESLGGWSRAKPEIIDAVWRNQVLRELHR
jgi:sulfate transport system substrate-binding protein